MTQRSPDPVATKSWPLAMRSLGLLAAGIGLATIALWTLDVLINLSPVDILLHDESFVARYRDFLGVALADLVAGALLTAIAAVGAWIFDVALGRIPGRRFESIGGCTVFVAALPSLLIGAALFSTLGPLWEGRSALKAAGAAGTTGFLVSLFFLLRSRPDPRQPAAALTALAQRSLLLPLVVGSTAAVLCPVPHPGRWSAAVALTLTLALLWPVSRSERRFRRISWLAAPLTLALALAGSMVARSSSLGAGDAAVADRARSTSGTEKPSIALVVLDTVRADHLDLYGYTRPTMPLLRAWARSALVFERVVSPGGWTAPAHASIFSGLTVSRHGIHYGEANQFRTSPVDGIDWLPAQLAARGYETLAVASNPLALPSEHLGFERRFLPSRRAWHDNHTIAVSVDDRLRLPVFSRWSAWLRWRDPHATAEQVIAIARRALTQAPSAPPVFLFLNFMEAHGPFNPTPAALSALGLEEPSGIHRYHFPPRLRRSSLSEETAGSLIDLYDGELRSLDGHLGPFLDEIVARLGPETVVVVTSDHGEELGEEGRYDHLFGVVQRLVHIPLVVRDPRLPEGRRLEVTSTKNLYGYLLGVADGRSEVAALIESDQGDIVVSERYPSGRYRRELGPEYGRPWVALFDGELKAVGPSSAGRELYRLDSRYQRELRIGESAATAHLFERLDRYWEEQRDRRRSALEQDQLEELQRLRALGYID